MPVNRAHTTPGGNLDNKKALLNRKEKQMTTDTTTQKQMTKDMVTLMANSTI